MHHTLYIHKYMYTHIIVNDTLKHCINEMSKSVIQLKVISVHLDITKWLSYLVIVWGDPNVISLRLLH